MGARSGQKLKLFYVADILKKYTDEDHPMPANEICDRLISMGITAERKAIYDDIECLVNYGFDIIKTRVPRAGYFLAEREFELPEIYLLCDAVRTAKFISAKKTRELTKKLEKMLSVHQFSGRDMGIYIDTVGKCANEEIFYTIDSINRAIENKKKITFRYGTRCLEDREIKTVYKQMTVSPYAMTWQDDHYYLIGNYEKYDNLIHLRIDRMRSVSESECTARPFSEVSEYNDVFDVVDYTKKLFSMYGGDTEEIELKCQKGILEQVTDRFTDKIFIKNVTEDSFRFSAKVSVSDALVTWIMNYGEKIEVITPKRLRDMVYDRANKILKLYK
ncbi:MAG: WYL domain-containing protein [Clostridia bacterium]|nr:WYL domain-containing protein [Clostridia bacterium]